MIAATTAGMDTTKPIVSNTGSTASIVTNQRPGFTLVGILAFSVVLWIASQNATGPARSAMNLFLFVLLVSMVLLNWNLYGPIFFKS